MPKYQREKSSDWVEIAGASDRELQELDVLYGADVAATQGLVKDLVKDCSFTNRQGEPVDPRENYRRLTHKQFDWMRQQIVKASLDETVDPEA